MSWTPVDFSLVRYSPIENTHFFYDANHPTSIQFLLSGRWEAWDVSYVGYKARDPTIRQIAKQAEARLVNDPTSGYAQWPAEPPTRAPTAPTNGHPAPPTAAQNHGGQPPTPAYVANSVPLSPPPEPFQPAVPSTHRRSASAALDTLYPSPNGRQQPTSPSELSAVGNNHAPVQAGFSRAGPPVVLQQQPYPPQGPLLAAHSAQPRVIISRRRETKILLSIDGDGIRGLSSLLVIESLVNAICVKVGQRLDPHQIFDLTGGCSLGGVIALLLCRLQMQPHRAREAYKKISEQVYHKRREFYMSCDPHVPLAHSDGAALERAINEVIQQENHTLEERLFDEREDSGDVFVVTTHIEIGTNKAALMRSYSTRRITGPDVDAHMTIAQAMKATAVAPKYMQSQPNGRLVIEPGLVDYGTAKNNPVRDILYECRKLFRYANDMMIIISIGPGIGLPLDCANESAEMMHGVEERHAEARAWGDKFEADHQPLMERGWMKYFRFNVPGLEDVPLAEWLHEDKLKDKTSAYLARPDVAHMFYACVDAITKLMLGPPG
ncbi:hypothetical protein ACEQ8H_000409 [Pleosporales sp. CAS-2024a]